MKWRWTAILLLCVGGVLILGALVVGGLTYFPQAKATYDAQSIKPSGALAVGNPAPDFQLNTLDGESVTLSDLQGRPVVINFWATWCPPCKEEMPLLQDYVNKYGDRFNMLAIDYGESADIVRPFVEELGLTFPILMDPGDTVNTLYRIQGYPTTFFVDSDGNIADIHIGLLTSNTLKQYMQKVEVVR